MQLLTELTLESTVILISNIPVAISFLLLVLHIFKYKNKHVIPMASLWFILFLINILGALGYSTLNRNYLVLRSSLFIVEGIILVISLDILQYEKIKIAKLLPIIALSTLIISALFQENSFILGEMPNGDLTLNHGGLLRISLFLLILYEGILYLIFSIQLLRRSPPELKVSSILNLIGSLLFGVISIITGLLGLTLVYPGVSEMFMGLGALFTTLAFSKDPRMCYVLPFKLYQIYLINTDSGVSLHRYTWNKEGSEIDSNLFTGFFQGIGLLAKEVIKQGRITEITLENGILIIEPVRNLPIASILLSNSATKSLRNGLKVFSDKIQNYLKNSDFEQEDLSQKEEITQFINRSFPYVPIH